VVLVSVPPQKHTRSPQRYDYEIKKSTSRDGLHWYDICTKFHDNSTVCSKVIGDNWNMDGHIL